MRPAPGKATGIDRMNRITRRPTLSLILFILFIPVNSSLAAAAQVTFTGQVLHVGEASQSGWGVSPSWWDLRAGKRFDMVLVQPSGRIEIFRQGPNGFAAEATQAWQLPADTALVGSVHLGKDDPDAVLFISTARGWFYYPQKDGAFLADPVPLLEERQVYARATLLRPTADWIQPLRWGRGLPLLPDDRNEVVKRLFDNKGGTVQLGDPIPLNSRWSDLSDQHSGLAWSHWGASAWSLGGRSGGWLCLRTTVSDKPKEDKQDEQDKDPVQRVYDAMPKGHLWDSRLVRCDVNGDGRTDAVIWSVNTEIQRQTTVQLFLVGADGRFRDQPDQVRRASGMPAVWDSLVDINGDGKLDLLMVEPRKMPTSMHEAIEMLVSGEGDGRIAIQPFETKGFARRPTFRLDARMTLNRSRLIDLGGDYNGDGRKDILVWRAPTEADVYLSRTSGELFERQPGLRFRAPAFSFVEAQDLNGDGIDDPVFNNYDDNEYAVYLSRRSAKEGPTR